MILYIIKTNGVKQVYDEKLSDKLWNFFELDKEECEKTFNNKYSLY